MAERRSLLLPRGHNGRSMAARDLRNVAQARAKLDQAYEAFYDAVRRARESGETIQDIAASTGGIRHQRVQEIAQGHRPAVAPTRRAVSS